LVTMTRRASVVILALVFGSVIAAAQATDVSGKWSGSLTLSIDGQQRNDTAFMTFTQKGSELTGSVGPRDDRLRPITNGKVEGNRVTFDVQGDGGPQLAFTLTLTDGRLKGQAAGDRNGQAMTAAVDVGRIN
jgi:hypothetical protein